MYQQVPDNLVAFKENIDPYCSQLNNTRALINSA